jgi:hypothetical protein
MEPALHVPWMELSIVTAIIANPVLRMPDVGNMDSVRAMREGITIARRTTFLKPGIVRNAVPGPPFSLGLAVIRQEGALQRGCSMLS